MIDHQKFRVYLKEKYSVEYAYYFIGYRSKYQSHLYENLEKAGFILHFKVNSDNIRGNKKGNVDSDIVFEILKSIILDNNTGQIIIVSGDGDYRRLIDFLIERNMFKILLFPNQKFASSLYSELNIEHYDFLDKDDVKSKIEYIKIPNIYI